MSSDYKEALHRILIYLTEDEKEATYTLNCFYNQDVDSSEFIIVFSLFIL